MGQFLPLDPRTLLETSLHTDNISIIGEDQMYWHNGLELCLQECLHDIDKSIDILLTFNIDGLPLFKRSTTQFWPILGKIHEMPQHKVFVVGIYCGKGKPDDIHQYLCRFVDSLYPHI